MNDWEESEQSKAVANMCGSFEKQLGGWGGGSSTTPRKHLSLETVFPALKLPQIVT